MYETVVYYTSDDAFARISTNEIKWKNWANKMAAEHPQEVHIQSESESYLVAQFPKRYLKLSPPRQMSEEQRQKAAERLSAYRPNKGGASHD